MAMVGCTCLISSNHPLHHHSLLNLGTLSKEFVCIINNYYIHPPPLSHGPGSVILPPFPPILTTRHRHVGWSCKLLLAVTSTVILVSESCRTHGHILLSHDSGSRATLTKTCPHEISLHIIPSPTCFKQSAYRRR
jgi:hypothetical protein